MSRAIKISEKWLCLIAKWWSKQETNPESIGLTPGLGCSKLSQDNPGLGRNFMSDLKALKEIFFVYNVVIGCSHENRENYSKEAFEQRN